ncbi:hypothetical protein SASPL_137300 [Salvia splendens]|uniref:Uncharacterized protein n=1 Tax=Salvia splendens TaxID=180675 RepID=A0A8X8ZD22_SALSN|nr:hypothetical protein SASPL_137300 [Salvia splendens]
MKAANYLNIEGLFDLVSQKIVDSIEACKSEAEMVYDFSPERRRANTLLRRPPRCRLRVRQARLYPGRRQVRRPSRGLSPPVRRPQIHPAAAEDKPAAETKIPSGGDVKKPEESGEVGDYAKKVEELLGAPGVELVSAADQVDAGLVYEVVEEGEVEVARDGEDFRRARCQPRVPDDGAAGQITLLEFIFELFVIGLEVERLQS